MRNEMQSLWAFALAIYNILNIIIQLLPFSTIFPNVIASDKFERIV